MIFALPLVALRTLVRACGPAPRPDVPPPQGGEDDVAAAPNPQEPVGPGDTARPPAADLVGAPAAYVMPTTLPYTNPSKIDRRCARCHASYVADDPREPLDLYWVGAELLCAPCAKHEEHDVTLERVVGEAVAKVLG